MLSRYVACRCSAQQPRHHNNQREPDEDQHKLGCQWVIQPLFQSLQKLGVHCHSRAAIILIRIELVICSDVNEARRYHAEQSTGVMPAKLDSSTSELNELAEIYVERGFDQALARQSPSS